MTKTVTTGKATDLITFTRSTTGTYLDSVKYGDELVTNGDFSNGTTGWDTSDGNITVVNGQLVINATPTDKSAYQQITLKPNTTYKVSIQLLTDGSYLYAYPQHNSNANTISGFPLKNTTSSGSVVNHSTFLTTTDTGELRLRLYTTNGDTGTFDNLSVKEVIGNQGTSGEPLLRTADTNEPRIEYDAGGNLKGLLIEEQRTNLVSNSDYANAFDRTTTGDVTITELNENKLGVFKGLEVASGGQTWHRVNKYVSVTSGTTYAVSFYYRYGTSGKARFELRVSGNSSVINTDEGVGYLTKSDAGGVVEFLSDEQFGDIRKMTCQWTPNATSTTALLGIATRSETVGETIIAYAVQCEAGSFATSYIPTSGSTVTRTNEVASLNASLFEYNGNEGTTLIEFDKTNWAYSTTFLRAYSWGHGSQSLEILNEVYNYGNSPPNSGKIRFRVDDSSANGVFGANFINGSESDNTAKVALALKDNDMAIAWKGTVVFTDTTGNPAIDLVTKLYIGSKFNEVSGGGVSDYMNGHIKSIKYYPVRLTNDEIKALTL